MHRSAYRRSKWAALAATLLLIFQTLIASMAMSAVMPGGEPGASTIICTANGPRVVVIHMDGNSQDTQQHSGALPHCCGGGCVMLGGAIPPELLILAWLLPQQKTAPVFQNAPSAHFSSVLAHLRRRSRAPPQFA